MHPGTEWQGGGLCRHRALRCELPVKVKREAMENLQDW